MKEWNQITNMRTTLLHLQYIYQSLNNKISQQNQQLQLNYKDRVIQLHELSEECSQLQQTNFKKILIVKLQSMLGVYGELDEGIWQMLDNFLKYVQYMEEEMAKDIGKLYIGDKVMMDISKCQKQLQTIKSKICKFMEENHHPIQQWNKKYEQVLQLQEIWAQYLNQVKLLKDEVQKKYPNYLKHKLQRQQKQIQKRLQCLVQQILS